MNQCHFLGNLAADPDLKTLSGDKRVVNFTVAVNRRFKRGTDTAKETAFLPCEAWDSGADLISKHFKKGDPIIVHASVKQDEWEDKASGQKRSRLKFRVNQFEFVPGKPGAGKRADEAPAADTPAAGDEYADQGATGEDIPF
jgi:single-strand DNA-binding protein